jgi:environmental stress-induced protein Ves
LTTGLSITRAANRAQIPWLNGGGVTSEIAVFPEAADMRSFDWRLSIATVSQEGEFSRFEGVERTIGILDGTLCLHFADGIVKALPPHGAPYAFDGEAKCVGMPIEGPVIDLNLMVRRGRASGRMQRISGTRVASTAGPTWAIAVLSTCLTAEGREYELAPGDVAAWNGTDLTGIALAGQAYLVEIF